MLLLCSTMAESHLASSYQQKWLPNTKWHVHPLLDFLLIDDSSTANTAAIIVRYTTCATNISTT